MKKLALFLCIVICVPCSSMEQGFKTPEKSLAKKIEVISPQTKTIAVPENKLISEQLPQGMKYLSQALTTLIQKSYEKGSKPRDNSLFICTPIFTFGDIAQELIKAKNKGVDVKVLLSPSTFTYRTAEDLKKTDNWVKIYKPLKASSNILDAVINDIHAKLFLYSIKGEKGYSIGSSNTSGYGLFHNNEITQITDHDSENYNVLLNDVKKIWDKSCSYTDYLKIKDKSIDVDVFSPMKKGQEGLKITPEKKRTAFTSLGHSLTSIVLDRLDPKKFEKGDAAWLSSFTFNNQELTDALCVLLDKGVIVTLYVDAYPFEHKENKAQMRQLFDCGAKIYKYTITDRYIHHAKFLLIKRQGNKFGAKKVISIISTQNVKEQQQKEDFDALSIDISQKVFDDTLKTAQSWETSKNFVLIDKKDFDEQPLKKLKIKK